MSFSIVGGELRTNGELITADGRRINLGQMDRRVGIRADVFGKRICLTAPWTPRLWYYKHFTYRMRQLKLRRKGTING